MKRNYIMTQTSFIVLANLMAMALLPLHAETDYLEEIKLPYTPTIQGVQIPDGMQALVEDLMKNPEKLKAKPELMKDMPKPLQEFLKGLVLIPEEKRRAIRQRAWEAASEKGNLNRLADGPTARLEMVELARPVEEFGDNERKCFIVRLVDESAGLLYGLCLVSLDTKSVKVLYVADIATDYIPPQPKNKE